jgi:uncharacterized protein involved in outer membrane biogenesis
VARSTLVALGTYLQRTIMGSEGASSGGRVQLPPPLQAAAAGMSALAAQGDRSLAELRSHVAGGLAGLRASVDGLRSGVGQAVGRAVAEMQTRQAAAQIEQLLKQSEAPRLPNPGFAVSSGASKPPSFYSLERLETSV